jgi:hypothetical protein
VSSNAYDLGSLAKPWQTVYVDTGCVVGGTNLLDLINVLTNTVILEMTNAVSFPNGIYLAGTYLDGTTGSLSVAYIAFDTDFIPTDSNAYDVGSPAYPVRTAYVSNAVLDRAIVDRLYDTNDQLVIDLGYVGAGDGRILYGTNAELRLDWQWCNLYAPGVGIPTVEWDECELRSTNYVSSYLMLDWGEGHVANAGGKVFDWTNTLTLWTNIVPVTSNVYDLGSIDKPWRDLYLGSNSVYLGGVKALTMSNGAISLTSPSGATLLESLCIATNPPGSPVVPYALHIRSDDPTGEIIARLDAEGCEGYARVLINCRDADEDAQVSFADSDSTKWSIGNDGTDDSFHINNTVGAFGTDSEVVITATGDVGIGTTAPNAKLDVNGSVVVSNDLTIAGNAAISGFTQLGDSGTPVKQTFVYGNLASTPTTVVTVAHGLTATNILNFSSIAFYGVGTAMPPGFSTLYSGYEFNIFLNGGNFTAVTSLTNSTAVYNAPFVITVLYRDDL